MIRNEEEVVLKATINREEDLAELVEVLENKYKIITKSRVLPNDRYPGFHGFITIKPLERDK